MRRLVVVPAFNEALVIFETLRNLKRQLAGGQRFDVVVVDDGSDDGTFEEARRAKVTVLRHRLNCGLGGVLGTGLEFAKRKGYGLMVTFDADGQHDAGDIVRAIEPIEKGYADLVIGTRMRSKRGQMPVDRVLINWVSNVVTWCLFGVWTSDSQSGFRVFGEKAISCIEVKTGGMEVSSEIFAEVKKNKLRIVEVPIRVIYTNYSRTKGQGNLNAFNILYKLLLRLVR